jgi:hypothetical protein
MPTLSIEKTQNLESTALKKGSAKTTTLRRRKAPSGAADPKVSPPPLKRKAMQIGAAKTPVKA